MPRLQHLKDKDWVSNCRDLNQSGLKQMQDGFQKLGLSFIPSYANFVLVNVTETVKSFPNHYKR